MKILIAKDKAFNFIYRSNVDALGDMGDVTFFSPLHDSLLPNCDLLYLPGGYPELYLDKLSHNKSMRDTIRNYAEMGGMIYAECGGFMFLCDSIDNFPMCGVLPLKATMANAKLHLGYRQMYLSCNGKEILIKGHEFHYSEIASDAGLAMYGNIRCERNQLTAKGMKTNTALYRYKNVVAGYTHWYWAEVGFPFFSGYHKNKMDI